MAKSKIAIAIFGLLAPLSWLAVFIAIMLVIEPESNEPDGVYAGLGGVIITFVVVVAINLACLFGQFVILAMRVINKQPPGQGLQFSLMYFLLMIIWAFFPLGRYSLPALIYCLSQYVMHRQ